MISVLLPTYNSEKYIVPCINSILNQTFKDFELLIVDSASTDRTVEIINSFGDPRINLHQIERCPLSTSLNYGLTTAKYDLIARMDSDDLMREDRLQKQFNYKFKYPEIAIITCRFAFFRRNKILCVFGSPEGHIEIVNELKLHNIINNPGSFFDRQIVLDVGGYNDNLVEDYELWLRLCNKVNFFCLSEVLIYMRYRQDSRSRQDLIETKAEVYKLQEKFFGEFYNSKQRKDKIIDGWREYFYGNKNLARKYWRNPIRSFPVFAAFLLTWLPESIFLRVKEMRLRLRLGYLLTYYSSENIAVRKTLKRLLKSVS